MKKIFMILASIALLASCNKDKEVELSYQLTANIDVLDVVNYVKNIDGSQIFENGIISSSSSVILSYIVFDKDGNAIIDEKLTLPNFAAKSSIVKPIKEGEYTIVTCAYINDDDAKWWTLNNKTSLRDYKIKYTDSYVGLYGVLGFKKQAVTISKSEVIAINVPPAVGQIFLDFDYLNLSGIQKIKLKIKTWNDCLNVSDEQNQLLELLNNGNVYTLTNSGYRNVYQSWYYLPTSKFTILWVGYDANGYEVKEGTIPSSAITAGANKIITINTNTGLVSYNTQSSKPNSINGVKITERQAISAQK